MIEVFKNIMYNLFIIGDGSVVESKTIKSNHNFHDYGSLVDEYLTRVYNNSVSYYTSNNGKLSQNNPDSKRIDKYIEYLDDYLYFYYRFYKSNFSDVFMSLVDGLKFVGVLPKNNSGIYEQYADSCKGVFVSPNLVGRRGLSSDDITRLYLCHGLGHVVNCKWVYSSARSKNEEFCDGISLLDEVTAQDRAESIAYYYAGKDRPKKEVKSSIIFNGEPYSTNFDFYGELQELALMFARTLRGIGSIENDDEALRVLDTRTLSPNFFDEVISEYRRDGEMDNLVSLFVNMGVVKNASCSLFSSDIPSYYIKNSKTSKDELRKLTNTLRDYRKPFSNALSN